MSARKLQCTYFKRLITDYVKLSPEAQEELEFHARRCARCSEDYKFEKTLRHAAERVFEPSDDIKEWAKKEVELMHKMDGPLPSLYDNEALRKVVTEACFAYRSYLTIRAPQSLVMIITGSLYKGEQQFNVRYEVGWDRTRETTYLARGPKYTLWINDVVPLGFKKLTKKIPLAFREKARHLAERIKDYFGKTRKA